jgi:hypothetical protein
MEPATFSFKYPAVGSVELALTFSSVTGVEGGGEGGVVPPPDVPPPCVVRK